MFRHRRLTLALIALACALAGCATADPRDPAVFRPAKPQYPTLER